MKKDKNSKSKPLGKFSPWAWALELVRGCNLRCGHCATRLFPEGKLWFMSRETWIDIWKIINVVSPKCRVELANAGEPTLHPDILNFFMDCPEIKSQKSNTNYDERDNDRE